MEHQGPQVAMCYVSASPPPQGAQHRQPGLSVLTKGPDAEQRPHVLLEKPAKAGLAVISPSEQGGLLQKGKELQNRSFF